MKTKTGVNLFALYASLAAYNGYAQRADLMVHAGLSERAFHVNMGKLMALGLAQRDGLGMYSLTPSDFSRSLAQNLHAIQWLQETK